MGKWHGRRGAGGHGKAHRVRVVACADSVEVEALEQQRVCYHLCPANCLAALGRVLVSVDATHLERNTVDAQLLTADRDKAQAHTARLDINNGWGRSAARRAAAAAAAAAAAIAAAAVVARRVDQQLKD